MHRNIILGVSALFYYVLSCYALYVFESGILTTGLILFGIPSYFLARFSHVPGAVMVSVLTLATGMAFILEGIAHIYGIWYTIGVDELRIFGLIPVEVILVSILQIFFLALLYELIFDDGVYTVASARVRFTALGVCVLSVIALVGIHQYLLQGIFFTHSYLWILGILVASSFATLAVHKALTMKFFDRLIGFSLLAAFPLLINLFLTVSNTHKVFAYVGDYLHTFSLAGSTFPVEEVALAFVMPLFVATFYELYLDDAQ